DDVTTKEELPIVEIDDKAALKTITTVLETESADTPQDDDISTPQNLDAELPPRSPSKPDNYITVKIKDFSGVLEKTEAQLFVFSTDTTFADIFVDVSCRFDIELGEFDIIFQDKSFSYNLGGLPDDQTLTSLNIVPDCDRTYWMSLDIFPQKKRKSRDTIRALGLESVSENENTSSHATDSCSSFGGKRDFVGLKNRNMTCYLNSFLQGLWFTPEFRNALYNYVYEPGRSNRKSLCHPLQKLFLQQQFSIRDSIETDELIRTFGWEDRETWNQHDIEELCSIFMENLTAEFKGTSLDGIIQALYFGSLDDYVKCLECNRVSQRTDDFLVVPLPIRNFGSLLPNPTLEAALNSFVAYEILDGNNMYNCSQCEKPCPAHKGLKFNRLPYILTIQLKRFEYDFIKDRRLKLNDRVAFPYVLDMNSYIETPSPDRRESLKIDMLKPGSMSVEGGRSSHSRPSVSLVDPEENDEPSQTTEEGAVGGEKPSLEQMIELRNTKGPEIYQLYGVMVHRGGINSGHYYAYIMDFERGKWFRCDDAAVRKVTKSDIEGAYGGDSDDDKELTSAYMLLYRRFDPDLNLLPYYLNDMPAHLQDMWNSTVILDKACHEEEELAKNTVRMPVLFRDPETNPTLQEKMVAIPKTLTMDEAANFVFKEIFPKVEQPPEEGTIRLCRYDKDLDVIENSFDNCEHMFIVTAIRHRPPVTKNEALLLERKEPKLEFDIFRHDDYIFRTSMIDCLEEDLLQVDEIHASPSETVEELMKKVQLRFSITEPITLVANFMSRYCSISGEKTPLSLFKFDRVNNLYFQAGTEEGLSDVMLDFVEHYTKAEIIEIHVQTPPHAVGNTSSGEKAITSEAEANTEVPKQAQPEATKVSNVSEAADLVNAATKPGAPKDTAPSATATLKTAATPETVKTVNETKPSENAVWYGSKITSIRSVNGGPPPSSNDASGSVPQVTATNSEPASKATGIKALAQKNGHYMKFMNKSETPEVGVYVYTLRIDGQTPLYALSKRVSQLISTNESDFVIYKIDGNETTELRRMTERICTIKPIDRFLVKLEHRLQDGESRIAISLLNVGCLDKPSEYLTDIVVTLKMNVDEVKSAILKKCETLQNDTNVDITKMRIRKKLRSSPSKIMRANAKLQDIFTVTSIQSGELFLQLLDSPCELTDKNYCFIYRHWHPSTGVLDATVEVTVFHDHSESLEDVILSKIRESLGVANDIELEAAKPDGHYPWSISPRVIQDLGWFSLSPPVKKSLYVYNDELVLFVRDKNEAPKEFYEYQAEPSIPTTGRRTVSSVAEAPRREPGLKLNLAQSPP
ncbi:Ubiquitin carboxyl-terminal hydrolase 64E, partial [Orchesella cincta]